MVANLNETIAGKLLFYNCVYHNLNHGKLMRLFSLAFHISMKLSVVECKDGILADTVVRVAVVWPSPILNQTIVRLGGHLPSAPPLLPRKLKMTPCLFDASLFDETWVQSRSHIGCGKKKINPGMLWIAEVESLTRRHCRSSLSACVFQENKEEKMLLFMFQIRFPASNMLSFEKASAKVASQNHNSGNRQHSTPCELLVL